jgi:hypothetical protein
MFVKVGQEDFPHLREKICMMGTIGIFASVDEISHSFLSLTRGLNSEAKIYFTISASLMSKYLHMS